MAKINIETEIDWLRENETLDEALENKIFEGVEKALADKLLSKAMERVKPIIDKIEATFTQRIDEYVENVISEKIDDLKIPVTKDSWSNKVEWVPMSEFVGQRYQEYITKLKYDHDFKPATNYGNRAIYSSADKCIRDYLDKILTSKVSETVRKAQADAERTVIEELEKTLKDQLTIDTIKRMNIPQVLKNLQEKALEMKEGK